MAALNMAAAQEALKLFYLPGLREQLNNANPVLAVLERDTESVLGGEIVMALRYGRQGGVGNRADDGTLPTPRSRQTKQAKWQTKNIFAHIQISDKTVKASRSSAGAFANLLEAELADAMTDAKDSLSRQVFGDGTGKLATFADHETATTTLTVDNTQYFAVGQFIDIVDSSGNVKYSGLEILNVDDDAKTITISGSGVATANTDFAVISGNYNQELTGFGAVFTKDNVLYGIDRSLHKWFNPTVIPVNGNISEVVIQKAIDEAERRAGGNINFLVASYGVRRAYQNLLTSIKRIINVMELKGGFKAIEYNGIPFTVDKYCPAGTLYGLDLDTWRLYHMGDWDWLDDDGAILSRVPDKPVWAATLARYCDLGCSKPAGNFVMTGITEA